MIIIKKYSPEWAQSLFNICHTAITQVCIKHYSQEQINAINPIKYTAEQWQSKMDTLKPFIASINGKAVGYADIQPNGYIDHFFVHGDFQKQGVGRALMNTLLKEHESKAMLHAHVSITARSFFESYGFKVKKENTVTIGNIDLINYIMELS